MQSLFIATLLSLLYSPVLGVPRLTVSSGEEFTVSLPSLLPGCDLEYNVTASEGLTAEVEDPNNLVLVETVPRRNVSDFVCAPLLISHEGNEYVLSEDGNLLIATEIKAAEDIHKIWEFPIAAEGVIRGLIMRSLNGVHLLFILFQTGDSHFEVYAIDLPDIITPPHDSTKLNLRESQMLRSVLFSVVIISDQSLTLMLAGHSPIYETQARNSLALYQISQDKEVSFLYEIHSYSEMPLDVVSLSSLGSMLQVLDSTLGLLILEPVFQRVPKFTHRVDLSGYGEPLSFRTQVGGMRSILVLTTMGLVAVDLRKYEVRPWLESLSLCNESWTLGDAEFSEQYLFTTGTTADDTFFQVMRTHSPIASRSWRLSDFIPRNMIDPQSPVQLRHCTCPTRYHLIRSDKDALRVFKLELGTAELRARTLSTGEFTAVVSGSQRFFPTPSAVETLAVEAISPTNSTILFGAGYSLDSISSVQTYTRKGLTAMFSFDPQELFSGPDLRFSIEIVNQTEGATVTVSPIPPLLINAAERVTCNVSHSAKFVTVMGSLFVVDDGALMLVSDPLRYFTGSRRGKVEGMKIVDVCRSCAGFIALGELRSGERLIADLSISNYQPKTTIGVTACDRIRSELNFIACIAPAYLTFVDSSLQLIATITAETLGLSALNITDVLLWYSEYSNSLYLFVSCFENGLFLVSMPFFEPPKLVKFLDSEAGELHIHSSYLCCIKATGELAIFDISHGPEVRQVRTLPPWSAGAVTSVVDMQSYISVQMNEVAYVYDLAVPVHKSLVAVLPVSPRCRQVADAVSLFEICESDGGFTVDAKAVRTEGNSSLRVEINAERAAPGVYQAVLIAKAENTFGAHAEALVAFDLIRV